MKKTLVSVLVLLFCLTTPAIAEDAAKSSAATRDECMQKVHEAAELAKKEGLEKAIAAVNDPKGQFVWKDTYVFCCDIETATMLAHAVKPGLIGKALTGLKDINGKMFFVEFTNIAKSGKPGWVDYMWPKANEKEPSRKSSYIYPVPELKVYFGAGTYE